MTEVPHPARRTIMCAATLLGATATLAACGNGESEAPVNTPAPIPQPMGEGQAVLSAEQLPVLSRAQVAAKDPATGHDIGVLLFRKDEQTVLAYSNICTHQGCAVGVKSPSKDDFYCACHGSHFEPDGGTATAGPAMGALVRYGCAIEGPDIVVYIPVEDA
ncbi:Rieske (2Fe-2S) protein [Glutamicibacter sp. MNS18]|uniref:Rieske (2Fe-2S) protein n=1 Tax=Glutamicibacter sp. MNS18 TaxID=2989817 RepID=UPI0022358D13|nr:Rieske (2Fe-2S) protein [Glutamicibacter sp. MNS18]MCW4464494.1 Rieske (2Fe-2S) protein [Glutamicibacter sp. MNS18]